MKHYERLTMFHEVYEEVRRYTTTTFTMKRRNLKKDNRGKQFFIFLNLNIKFGPSFKRKHSQVRVKYR